MSAVSKIMRLLSPSTLESGLLVKDLMRISSVGASSDALAAFEASLSRPLSTHHRTLLSRWNGIDLDVIHIFGVPPVEDGLRSIPEYQPFLTDIPGFACAIAFASDPSGFLYVEQPDGSVYSLDHDGAETKQLASSIDEFIDDLVFGHRSVDFMGNEWFHELHTLGLLQK